MPDFYRGKVDMFDSTKRNSNLGGLETTSGGLGDWHRAENAADAHGRPDGLAQAQGRADGDPSFGRRHRIPGGNAVGATPGSRAMSESAIGMNAFSGPTPYAQAQGGMTTSAKFAGLLSLALFCIAAPATAQTVIFQETFDNGNASNSGNPILTNTYVGPGPLNMTYAADPVWTGFCNGLVTAAAVPVTNAVGLAACAGPLDSAFNSWNGSATVQNAIGGYNNGLADGAAWFPLTPAQRALYASNISITAWTNGNPPVGSVILRNAQPIPFPAVPAGGTGRFITFQFTGAATSCAAAAHPLVTINLNGSQLGGQIDLCTSPAANVRSYSTFTRGGGGAPERSRVANYTPTGTGSALIMGGGLTFAVINQQAGGQGNDWGYDNFTALDVTPSVTKAVDIASNYVGQVKRITFTITNTNGDNGAKVGWGFTDTLPTNVVIAPTPNATTTCAAGTTMTATAGAGIFTVAGGNLIAGTAGGAATTCTVSVNVTSNVLGTFTNTQANYTSSTGLNVPNQSVPLIWVANTVTITKISTGGTGTFNFSGGNGIANHAIVTTAAGAPGTAGAQQTLVLTSTTTTTDIVEAATAGWAVNGTPGCTVGGVALAGTAWAAGTRTLTLPALPLQAGVGRNVQCTFTNQQVVVNADLAITKSNTFTPAQPSDLPNDTVVRGATTTYTLVATNHGPSAVTGAIVRDTQVAGITCAGTNTVTIDYSGTTPDTTSDVATLTSAGGIVLGAIGNGETATLTFNCTVN